jgi:hypothetical protein
MTTEQIRDVLAEHAIIPLAIEPVPIFDVSVIPPLILGSTWNIELILPDLERAMAILGELDGTEHLSFCATEEVFTPWMAKAQLN